MYLHVTFGRIFTIQQGLISCPLHWKTTLEISAEVDVILVGVLRIYAMNMSTSLQQGLWRIIILKACNRIPPILCITFVFRS